MERTKFISGVYAIINIQTNHIYIGSAANIKKRLFNHKSTLKRQKHINSHLQRSWNKYGEEAFKFKIICYCSNKKRIIIEQSLIDKYIMLKKAYNMYPKAGSPLGSHHSEETKQKQSKAKQKYWETHEHPFKEKNPFYKKKHTKETCHKIGKKNRKHMIGNSFALGNKFSHSLEELEKMKNSWSLEMREKAKIRMLLYWKKKREK